MNSKKPKDVAGKISFGIFIFITFVVCILFLLNLAAQGSGAPSFGEMAVILLEYSGLTLAPVGAVSGIIGVLESPRTLATIGLFGNFANVIFSMTAN
jgi:hypothetical protein